MSSPDLEALVTPRIADAIQSAVDKIGRSEFESLGQIDDKTLDSIVPDGERYVTVGLVTLACQINKSHGDPNPEHSSVTECLRGTTIRMPASREKTHYSAPSTRVGRRVPNLYRDSPVSRTQSGKSFRLLGFSVNTITFLLLGYFLGGVLVSPLLGEPSCVGIGSTPPSLVPCSGSVVGVILGAIGGLGYTYYYFVKKV